MATSVIDTAGWRVIVPLRPALDLAGSRLTAILTGQFGGAVAALDSASLVPGYDGAHQIDWTADPATGLTDRLILTITRAARGDWLATGTNGLPGAVTLFADVQRAVAGSARDPDWLGRTGFLVLPGTASPAVAARGSGSQVVLTVAQPGQTITAVALQTGPQGPRGETGAPGADAIPPDLADLSLLFDNGLV